LKEFGGGTGGLIIPDAEIKALDRAGKLFEKLLGNAKAFGAIVGGGLIKKLLGEVDTPSNKITAFLKKWIGVGSDKVGDAEGWIEKKLGIASANNPIATAMDIPFGEFFGPRLPRASDKYNLAATDKLNIKKGQEMQKEKRELQFQMMTPQAQFAELQRRIREIDSTLSLSPEAFAHLGVQSKESLINQKLQEQVKLRQMAMQYEVPMVRDSLAAIGGGSQNTSAVQPLLSVLGLIQKSSEETAQNTNPGVGKPRKGFP
jgi:hypothetical protein